MFSYNDYLDGICTHKEYAAQFNPIKPELGKTYVQRKGQWNEFHYLVVYLDEKVALCKAVKGLFIGDYELFYANNGFRKNDTHAGNRLMEEVL